MQVIAVLDMISVKNKNVLSVKNSRTNNFFIYLFFLYFYLYINGEMMIKLNLMCDVISHKGNDIRIKANEQTRYLEDEAEYIIEKLGDGGSFWYFEDNDIINITL